MKLLLNLFILAYKMYIYVSSDILYWRCVSFMITKFKRWDGQFIRVLYADGQWRYELAL